jgi:hypothetical protein
LRKTLLFSLGLRLFCAIRIKFGLRAAGANPELRGRNGACDLIYKP